MSIYFYSHNFGDYKCFSNFYQSKFNIDNLNFNCSEQYFMYIKCLTFEPENQNLQKQILEEHDPSKIKSYGRMIKNYNEKKWNFIRYDVMKTALINKFSQNEDLRNILLSTKNKKLYEASKYDKIWGIGFSKDQIKNVSESEYGQNLLGKCLMEVRELFKGAISI